MGISNGGNGVDELVGKREGSKSGVALAVPSQTSERAATKARQIAIALQFEPGRDFGPRVVATGKGAVAEQILAIAFANGVKVREDADLAEILSVLEVDSIIPVEVLATVAEILAYVYRANGAEMPEMRPQ